MFSKLHFLLIPFLVIATGVDSVKGQNAPGGDVHVVTREDGRAFVYHGQTIPLSHGFNVYRSVDGQDWQKLTESPRFPATDGYEFQKRLGALYPRVREMVRRDDPQAVFLRLHNSSDIGLITSFAIPEVAESVGRLFIDEEAPVGDTVYYRFEIVDDLERPTGEQIEGRAELQPVVPPPPSELAVANDADEVALTWNYLPSGTEEAKNVIRFQIYYREEGRGNLQRANDEFIARTSGDTEFQYNFRVPELGKTYTFTIHAVDFTGRMSEPSDGVNIRISENRPPAIVRNVKVQATDDYHSHITWPVSTELDLAGYHLYRARGDQESYTRLTRELLPALETAYLDTTVEPGNQYRYSVTAVDTAGNEGPRSNPGHLLITDYRVPDPVKTFEAEFNEGAVQLSWSHGAVPGNLRTYFVMRRQTHPRSGESFSQVNKKQLSDTTLLDNGVGGERFVEGAVYQYGISVISSNGNASDTVYAELQIPDLTPPESPTFAEAEMEEGRRVGLRWNASSSTDVNRYRVYRSLESRADTLLAELPRGKRYFRDEEVDFGNTYLYSVTAVDSMDNESIDAPVDTLHARRLQPPVPARNLQAMEMEEGVQLRWEQSTDEQVVGYRIYKSSLATGIYETIGETAGNTVEWVDQDGSAGTWYKVFPVDRSGREARTAKPTQAVQNNSR
ncbi:fibronectin type III domain-containing protein [Halalkalibaculum sp. DA3122]|uniref:fibronectin type III domain-containing protein n=1 Tax=Halalkalibaculum sp. DA3122 TaxID=3373607 RepID=UPI0037549E98